MDGWIIIHKWWQQFQPIPTITKNVHIYYANSTFTFFSFSSTTISCLLCDTVWCVYSLARCNCFAAHRFSHSAYRGGRMLYALICVPLTNKTQTEREETRLCAAETCSWNCIFFVCFTISSTSRCCVYTNIIATTTTTAAASASVVVTISSDLFSDHFSHSFSRRFCTFIRWSEIMF